LIVKQLLKAVKKQLQIDLGYIRPGDVFIAPHEDFIPADAKFPCIGIKDGGITRTENMDSCMEYAMDVILIPWAAIVKPEASIIGNESTGVKGILDISDDIHASLDENLLDIDGMIEAFSPSETGSEMLNMENRVLQKKQITYRYVKQGDRP
jgi:hypothetical protein